MRRFLLLLLGVYLCLGMRAQITTQIDLNGEQSLTDLLTNDEIERTEKIVISGEEVSNQDFLLLKRMSLQYKLREIDIANTFTSSIPMSAFELCENLVNIKLPQFISSIGESAFNGCKNLQNVEFPPYLNSIMRYAFRDCHSITSISFNRRLENIETGAFLDCNNISEIHCKGTIPPDIERIFSDAIYGNATLYVPIGYKDTYALFDGWVYFSDIKEENVEKACMLSINVHNGRNCYLVCPANGGAAWAGHRIDIDRPLEMEKGETIYLATDLWLNYTTRIYVDSIIVNGEDMTSHLMDENKSILPYIIEGDTQIDIYMTKNDPTSNEEIEIKDKLRTNVANGSLTILTPNAINVQVYSINGTCHYNAMVNGNVTLPNLPMGIYIVVAEDEIVKVSVR